jgi:hypothetical protein
MFPEGIAGGIPDDPVTIRVRATADDRAALGSESSTCCKFRGADPKTKWGIRVIIVLLTAAKIFVPIASTRG